MDTIMKIVNWVLAHKTEIGQMYIAAIALASIIVKVLPPLPANSWILPIVKFLGKYIALNKTVTDDQRPIV